jgi:hypothetical protein
MAIILPPGYLYFDGLKYVTTTNVSIVPLAGDVTGNLSTNTVVKLQNYSVSSAFPNDGYVLTWSASSNQWQPKLASSGTAPNQSMSGVISGTTTSNSFTTGTLSILSQKQIALWLPSGASSTTITTAATAVGIINGSPMLWSGVNSGLGRAVTSTNHATRMKRVNMKSLNNNAGQFSGGRLPASDKIWTAGSGVSGDGSGFYAVHRWVEADPAPVAGRRSFIGFNDAGSSQDANVEPDTLLNRVGIGQLSTDSTQFYWIQGGSVAQAAVAIGVAFPPGGNSVNAYELTVYAPSSIANTFYLTLKHLISGVTATHTMTGTSVQLPQSTTFLNFNSWACNNSTALEICLDWVSLYVESDP